MKLGEYRLSWTLAATECRQLLRLALPLMGAQMAQMGMGVTDTIMAGRYSSVDLAGVALGGSLMWPVLLLIMGVVQAVTPTVSQLSGARSYGEIGEVVRQGLWLALAGGLAAALLFNLVGPVYALLKVPPEVSEVSVGYLRMYSLGVPALMCFFCLRYLADGMGYTRPALMILLVALACKIPLNYLLIHGLFGLPELGGVGCGLAQAIVMWVQLLMVLLVVTRPRFRITGWLSRFSAPDWNRLKPLIIIGLPIGTTAFAEIGLFAGITLLLGRYGPEVVASHNIAMSVAGLVFMLPLALGIASTIRIGHRIGAGKIRAASVAAGVSIAACTCVALFSGLLVFLTRDWLVLLYSQDPAVMALAGSLLLLVVSLQWVDNLQATALGCLRGYKDTRVPMYFALLSYWLVGLPTGSILGFGLIGEPMGVYGFWLGLILALLIAAILLCYRLWWVSQDTSLIWRLSGHASGSQQSAAS